MRRERFEIADVAGEAGHAEHGRRGVRPGGAGIDARMQPHSVRRPPDMIVPVAAHIALNVPLDRNRPYPFLACLRASIANAGAGRKRSVAPARGGCRVPVSPIERARSEEHTSELQSLMRISYAVLGLK